MAHLPNGSQAEFWAGPSGTSWITHETDMDRLLAPVARLLLERAGDVRGRDVLDVGCGTGAVSLVFSDAGARVLASDISKPLLARTATRAAGQLETVLADAQTADWPRPFDLAVSRFGVMFFADPAQAFANIARALKPGGQWLFAAWGPFYENPWWHMPQAIAADHMKISPSRSDPRAPGPMGLSDREWSLRQMRVPGLSDVDCETVDLTLDYPDGAAAAGALATRVGPAARVLRLEDASETDRTEVARLIAEELAGYETEGTVRIPARLHLYSARKA